MSLIGKSAVITGGSRGIGWAIARRFAESGASVCLVARNQDRLDQAVKTLPSNKGQLQEHSSLVHDVTQPLPKSFKSDILVNSAGVAQNTLLLVMPPGAARSIIETNLLGTVMISQSMIKHMLRQRSGTVINLSSVLAAHALPGASVYGATKAGVEMFTKSMAKELKDRNIRFNCLRVGLVDTDMGQSISPSARKYFEENTPGNKLVTVDQVADAALALATNTDNGRIVTLDSGFLDTVKNK